MLLIMKRIIILALGLMLSVTAFGQSNLVISAFNYLNSKKLDKALENIEPTIIHPKTMGEAKTWLYRGNIYLAIALTTQEEYKNLSPNPLDSAYKSYQRSIEIDKDFVAPLGTPQKAELGLYIIGEQYYNKGVELFNKQEWTNAKDYFERTRKINSIFGVKDSLATYNATLCALKLGDNATGAKYLKELISMNYSRPEIFSMLANIYKEEGDTVKMINTVKMGRKRFPEDLGLIISETNYFLAKGDLTSAQNLLKVAVEKDPTNPDLHFAIGSNYDRLSRDSSMKEAEKELMLAEAEKAYLKAIEIKPAFFDAYYNVGALFFNKGVEVFEFANTIPPDQFEAYEAAKKKYMGFWENSRPYLEMANQLLPSDIATIQALKLLYARLNMPDKLKAATDRLDALKNGTSVEPIVKEKIAMPKSMEIGNSDVSLIKVGDTYHSVISKIGSPINKVESTTASGKTLLLEYPNGNIFLENDVVKEVTKFN